MGSGWPPTGFKLGQGTAGFASGGSPSGGWLQGRPEVRQRGAVQVRGTVGTEEGLIKYLLSGRLEGGVKGPPNQLGRQEVPLGRGSREPSTRLADGSPPSRPSTGSD